LRRDLQKCRAVLPLPQKRQHFATEAAHFAIRQNRFQPVSDFRPVLSVVDREKHHHATVFASWPDAPFLKETIRKILRRISFKRVDGYNGKLRICFPIELLTQGRDFLARFRIHCASEVVDVTLRRKLFDLFRSRENSARSRPEKCR
jgi:hypothetical protein